MIQTGVSAIVDDLGALPVFSQCLDGNRNGFTAIREQYQLLQHHLNLPDNLLLVSDRGTFSSIISPAFTATATMCCARCPGRTNRGLYDRHAASLNWKTASFLSVEQRRRRETNSSLPREDYQIAVHNHEFIDSDQPRRSFRRASSSSAAAPTPNRSPSARQDNIAKIRGRPGKHRRQSRTRHPRTDPASVGRQVARLFGKKDAAKYFRWDLTPLSAEEKAAAVGPGPWLQAAKASASLSPSMPPPPKPTGIMTAYGPGHDGAANCASGDELFTMFKQQTVHRTAAPPVEDAAGWCGRFSWKSPERVEAFGVA